MAVGTLYLDMVFRPRGRAGVLAMGRVKMGTAFLYPKDLNMKTIKSIVFTPWLGSVNAARGRIPRVMSGSIGSIGVLDTHQFEGTPSGNYVRVRTMQGSMSIGWGTVSLVGNPAGTLTASFIATGE